jgi:N-acetylglutamate synthase/N-acetylornithine aminotransferase
VAGVLEDRVAVASTGVIGVPLDTERIIRGLAEARRELAPAGDGAFGEAIRTTPTPSPRTPRCRSGCPPARCGCARRPRARG